jgi:hypothetical protein
MGGSLFFIGLIVAVVLVVSACVSFYRDAISVRAFIFWTLFGLSIGSVSVFPGIIDRVAALLGVEARGLLVVTLGLAAALLMLHNNALAIRRLDATSGKLAQEISLLRYQLDRITSGEDHAHRGGDHRAQ